MTNGSASRILLSPRPPQRLQQVQIFGRLEIPRLGMNVVVLEGSDDDALALGPGHLQGTAWPGEPGNTVIAGHRDMTFRALRHIHLRDRIQLSGDRTYTYVVRKILIVDPQNRAILEDSNAPTLTLITCYPFRYIGSAPKRFVIQASLANIMQTETCALRDRTSSAN